MKIASLIARLLLGALMVFAGSNHIFNFLPKAPLPPGVAGQFLGAMIATGYLSIVGACEVAAGLLLLVNRFVPLALAVLGAVIVNIFIVNLLMAPKALPIAIVVIILWILVAYRVRTAFLPLLQQRVAD
ncbi:MAG: DoxX family membrane protein [Terracidiphilus sp.]